MGFILLLFNIFILTGIVALPFQKVKYKAIVSLIFITISVILSSFSSFYVFQNGGFEFIWNGSLVTGPVAIKIDYLSAWFILIFNFTFLTGAFYGVQYLKKYRDDESNLSFHGIAYFIAYGGMINLTWFQNSIVFLIMWELMALSSFILVIFEYKKTDTLKAGMNFLIQSHISVLFLTFAFLIVRIKTGSFDFESISQLAGCSSSITTLGVFLLFFAGFGIKAGFVPFHTWLPHAHPAAPSHISGVMSGAIIKIGIYGIFRILLLMNTSFLFFGYFILTISVITGIYGVMLALVQHNLKKLLAYHSIENIGIIGIGIGLGCLGLGYNLPSLVIFGFGGALLHTLNHSLFKSLLFYSAGMVYQATHTMNIDSLGGLIKKMPFTASLFLIGSLAICGLPPFNGFISEFLIFSGFFNGIHYNSFALSMMIILSLLALVLIGGLAILCFTKAFGITFLGTQRSNYTLTETEKWKNSVPQYFIVALIIAIGILPIVFVKPTTLISGQFIPSSLPLPQLYQSLETIAQVGLFSILFILAVIALYLLKKFFTTALPECTGPTWGCGFTGDLPKAQYTGTSYIRTFRQIASPVIGMHKHKTEPNRIFPAKIAHETHAFDKLEFWLIDKPIYWLRGFLSKFTFLQNGNIQAYILYGFVFIIAILIIPTLFQKIKWFFDIFQIQ